MPSECHPVLQRVRERVATGSDGRAEPGTTGQSRARRRIDIYLRKMRVWGSHFFRQNRLYLSLSFADFFQKKIHIVTGDLSDKIDVYLYMNIIPYGHETAKDNNDTRRQGGDHRLYPYRKNHQFSLLLVYHS